MNHNVFFSEQLKEHNLFKRIQLQIERNRWMQMVQYTLVRNVTTNFKRTKLLVVGNGGAGKTSTIRSLLTKEFQTEYDSTEVADANVQVSLLSALDWRPQQENSGIHFMEADFKQAVLQVTEDKAVESFASVSNIFVVPALNPKVLEAISDADGIQNMSSDSKKSSKVRNSKIMGGLGEKNQQLLAQCNAKTSNSAAMALSPSSPVQDRNSASFTIWDFGGQEVFYHLHNLFLTRNGVYLMVLNPVQLLKNLVEELENLSFWTDALLMHAPEAPMAFVATRAGEVNQEEVQFVDNILTKFCSDREGLNIMFNDSDDLMFFPVENSLKNENEKYLAPLKAQIHQVVTNKESSNRLHGVNERIKLSWIYIMDSFVREAKSHMLFKQMMFHCKRLGILDDELEKILTFYTEVGTIVYFPPKNEVRTALNELAILNPQWLLKALACYIYDSKVHRRKRYKIKNPFKVLLTRYENTGILSRTLLEHLWRDYKAEEVAFFESLSSSMLLTSKYVFDAEEVEGAVVDGKAYVVPAMLKDYEGDVLEIFPAPAMSFNASIRFDGPMPTGIFERFISEFVRKSGQFEGSQPPRLFRNFADFAFGSRFIYSALQKKTKTIELSTMRKDGENHMRRAITFASDVVKRLVDSILGEAFVPTIFVQATGEGEIFHCKLNDLWRAVENEKENVAAKSEKNMRVSVTTEAFSAFFRVELDAFQPAIRYKGSNEMVSMPKHIFSGQIFQEIREKNHKYHAFLAHEWGTASRGHQTHEHVVAIKQKLDENGINTWIEEKNIHVCTMKEILRGFRSSRKVVVFLTRRYMERIMDPENNVTKQFRYGMNFRREDIIIVIMEEALLNSSSWFGPVVEYKLEEVCQIDFSNTTRMNKNLDKLVRTLKL